MTAPCSTLEWDIHFDSASISIFIGLWRPVDRPQRINTSEQKEGVLKAAQGEAIVKAGPEGNQPQDCLLIGAGQGIEK